MPLPTGRFREVAEVHIDESRCNQCGLCLKVCRGAPLVLHEGRVVVDQTRGFGCIACGQCAAVCPEHAIFVEGRDLTEADLGPLPAKEHGASYDTLLYLAQRRRSVRDFARKQVDDETLEKILAFVETAPMGLPPTDVGVVVFRSSAEVRQFSNEVLEVFKSWLPWIGKAGRTLFGPFLSRASKEALRDFAEPVIRTVMQKRKEGSDWLLYGAPAALYFYGSDRGDPADPAVAATYAMFAAESLGLATCFIGTPGYAVRYNKRLRQSLSVPENSTPGLVLLLGYSKFGYRRSIRRHLAKVGGPTYKRESNVSTAASGGRPSGPTR